MIHEGRNVGHGGSNGLVDWGLGEIAKSGPAEEGVFRRDARDVVLQRQRNDASVWCVCRDEGDRLVALEACRTKELLGRVNRGLASRS